MAVKQFIETSGHKNTMHFGDFREIARPLQSNQNTVEQSRTESNQVEQSQTKSNCNNLFPFDFVTVFDCVRLCSTVFDCVHKQSRTKVEPKSNQKW